MSQTQTIQLITAYYQAFNAEDTQAILNLLTDDVVHDINQGGQEIGRDRFAAFLARMAGSYREQLQDLVVMATQDGSRASAEFMVHGQYLKSEAGLPPANGQTYTLPAGAFFTVREGKIARVTNYYNLPLWVRQVETA